MNKILIYCLKIIKKSIRSLVKCSSRILAFPVRWYCPRAHICAILRKLNAEALGKVDIDPFYGAPTIILVCSRADNSNCIKDGSLVIANIMLAAHSIGLGSCWINRCKEMLESEEGRQLAARLGIPEGYEGVGCVALGYKAHEAPAPAPRKEDYYRIIS